MDKETQEEFVKVRTEFSQYQKDFDIKMDNFMSKVMDKLRPPFTLVEIIGLILVFLGMMAGSIAYVASVKEMVNTTNEKAEKQDLLIKEYQKQLKEDRKDNSMKTDKILETVLDIKIDVAVLKENNKEKKRPTNAQKQQMILDWANGNN
jgi:hypothetical protein